MVIVIYLIYPIQFVFGNDLPEHIYVISLDRTPERLEFVKKQLDREKLSYTHFHAIDGRFCTLTDIETHKQVATVGKRGMYLIEDSKNRNNKAKFIYISDNFGRFLSSGEKGCILSHRGVWLDMVKHGYKSVIVLEDDVLFVNNFKENLKKLINNLPTDCDVLFLDIGKFCYNTKRYWKYSIEFFISTFQNTKSSYYAKIVRPNDLYGTHSYYVTLSAAEKLLRLTRIMYRPIDCHMLSCCDCLNMYVSKVKLLTTGMLTSIIGLMSREAVKTNDEKL